MHTNKILTSAIGTMTSAVILSISVFGINTAIGASGTLMTNPSVFSGASSTSPYIFSMSKVLQANNAELSIIVLREKINLQSLTKIDQETRATNWTSFHTQYEKGVNKFLRKLTKTERLEVNATIAKGKINVDAAEATFTTAQKNKDIPSMSGALIQIIQANNDRFNAVSSYISSTSVNNFHLFLNDMNAVKTKNMTMRIANTQSWIDLSKKIDGLRNTIGVNTTADLRAKLDAIPSDLLSEVINTLLAQIDKAKLRNETSTSTMKKHYAAQLEIIRSIISSKGTK